MANTAQTRKRARQTVKQRAHNVGLRSTLRTAIKKIQKTLIHTNQQSNLNFTQNLHFFIREL